MLQHLTVPVEWKSLADCTDVPPEWKAGGDDGNTLVGYAATFGNVDLGGDVVMPGAFDKSIETIKATGVPLLADHMAATASVLGTIRDAVADRVGLKIMARLSKAPSAQDTAVKLREGHLSKLSIGYETMDEAFEDRDGRRVRLLNDVKLWETSVVVFPMNPEAVVEGVKQLVAAATEAGVTGADVDAVTAADFTAWADADLSRKAGPIGTLSVWLEQYDVELRTGVKSDTPAPAGPGSGSVSPQQQTVDAGGDPAPTPGEGVHRDPDTTGGDPVAASGEDAPAGWDHWTSDALLAERPLGEVDAATRAALKTRLELAESQFPSAES